MFKGGEDAAASIDGAGDGLEGGDCRDRPLADPDAVMADDARLVGAEGVAVVCDGGFEGGLDVVVGAARDVMDGGDGDEATTRWVGRPFMMQISARAVDSSLPGLYLSAKQTPRTRISPRRYCLMDSSELMVCRSWRPENASS